VTRQEAQIALNRAAERAWTDRDDDSMILLGRALMVLAALPEEDAPREREERRKGFALGMQEAEAIVRKQRTEGMGMVDATKARDAAADCISIRACAFAAMFAAPASPPSVTPADQGTDE
jgi:hypothetical protein